MRIVIKTFFLTLVAIMLSILLLSNAENSIYTSAETLTQKQINAAVALSSFEDPYPSLVRKDLEEIQNRNGSNVKYTFYDGNRNQSIQNKQIDSILKDNYDLLLVNSVELSDNVLKSIVNKAKMRNVPLILFNIVPFSTEPIKSYSKAIIISPSAAQSGISQGKLVINEWNSNKKAIDKNGDNILQYIMLKGTPNNALTTARTLYSIAAINNAGIRTKELASISENWDEKSAKNAMESLFLKYGNTIEGIISNNDAMALGAIEALQKYGYNKDDKLKYIPVFGIGGLPQAIDLINKGIMTGTIIQDPTETAQALYTIGMNLVNNVPPLVNTNYNFDETGITIEMPYHEYIHK